MFMIERVAIYENVNLYLFGNYTIYGNNLINSQLMNTYLSYTFFYIYIFVNLNFIY